MDRRNFLITAAGAGAQVAWAQTANQTQADGKLSEGRQRIARAMRAALAMQRRDWEQGILAQGLLEAGDREGVILMTKAAMVQQTPDGRMGVVGTGGPTDPGMGGAAYAQAAEWTGDGRMQQAVKDLLAWIRSKAPRSKDGILY